MWDAFSVDNEIVNAPSNAVPPVVPSLVTPPPVAATDFDASVAAIASVRLPGFWRHSPKQWFTHAEAIFANQRIRADLTRVNHVLASLDEDGIRTVSDLLGPDARYALIKERLITAYAVPQATRFRSIVQPGGLGDRRPSQLLRDMRSVLPEGIGDAALKEFWLQKLPPAILTVIAGLDGSLDSLAERADRVMDVSMAHDVAAVSASSEPDRLRRIEDSILALTTQIAALATMQTHNRPSRFTSSNQRDQNRSPSRPRSRSRTRNKEWCSYHNNFGKRARNCRPPCTFVTEN